jgi:arylsulfatase A-like enzyme
MLIKFKFILLLSSLICGNNQFFYAQKKPNIIFILADDLGYGDLQSYGAKDIQTPNIDSLTKTGTTFTNAYANSTVCSPSRAAILTGNYPDLVGVPGVIRDNPDNTWGNLADDLITLPEALKKVNYQTALIGKWHLGYESPDLPNNRGFDFFKGFVGDMMDDYYTHQRNGINWMRENEKEIHPKGHATDLFTNWTLDYLNEKATKKEPFFLFLTYNAPHDPVQPPTNWLDKIKKREPNASLERQKIIALIEHLDTNIGKIVTQLKEQNLFDDTLIVFTSDNGGALQYGASNYPLSGGKGDLLEGGIKIPCIVKLPNQQEPKTSVEKIMLMDFYPTLLKLAGGEISNSLPSKEIKTITNKKSEDTRYMIWMHREGHKYGGQIYYAISDGEYKLTQKTPFSEYQLYNLLNDPKETTPVKNPEKFNLLKAKLMKHIQKSGKIPWQ